MSRHPGDRVVAEYLAQAAAAASGLLPAQREEFLDRLHDEVRERVGVGPREDIVAVTSALAELGRPADLVAREQARLAGGGEVKVRDVRRQARPWSAAPAAPAAPAPPVASAVVEAPAVQDVPEHDGLTAAVVRQRSWDLPTEVHDRLSWDLPTEIHHRPLFRDTQPDLLPEPPVLPGPSRREKLRAMRWELATLAMFLVGPQFVGLLGLLLGGAMVARSAFWEVRDKVRALLGIPVGAAMFVLLRAWAESTQLNQLETSSARLRAAGDSLWASAQVAIPLLGLLIAGFLAWLLARDTRWGETARRSGGSGR